MKTYAAYAPRFKPPGYKNRNRLVKGKVGVSEFMRQNVSELNIVVFGCGTIGSRTIQTILENREWHSQLFNQRYNIKAIFDSSGFVYNGSNTGDYGSSINDPTLVSVLEWKHKNKNPLRVFRNIGHYYTDFERISANLLGANNTILIDTTNEEHSLQNVFLEHSKKGGGVIFANKKLLSSSQHTFDNLTSPERLPRIGYEPTVGAQLPFVNTLRNLIVSGDNVYKIEGILSGSIGWILGKWQRLKNSNLDYEKTKGLFADIMMEAHCNKLTEPDPRDDVLGIDNARKAVILARTLGINCDLDTVLENTTSLLPLERDKVMEMTPEEFTKYLKGIGEDEMEQYLMSKCVNEKGNANQEMNLKYVTVIDAENEEIRIELRNLNQDDTVSGFAHFKHVYGLSNMLQFTTDSYPEHTPLIIQGTSSGTQSAVNSIMAELHRVGVAINHTY